MAPVWQGAMEFMPVIREQEKTTQVEFFEGGVVAFCVDPVADRPNQVEPDLRR